MPNGLIIFISIVVLSAVIGAVTQWLKAQQQAEQERLAQTRAGSRADRSENTIDKYVEEIERLRKRPQDGTPLKARPVVRKAEPVVVEPVKKQRVAGEASFATMAAPVVRAVPTSIVQVSPPAPVPVFSSIPTSIPPVGPSRRIEELPLAPLIFKSPAASVTPAQPTSLHGGIKVTSTPQNNTEFAASLMKILASPQALPLAVVLQEILGSPRCRKA